MKKHIISLFALTAAILAGTLTSCTDELVSIADTPTGAFTPKGETVDAYLTLNVATLSVKATTRDASDETEAERRINDIWVFQYDYATGNLISKPYYRTIEDQEELADLTTETGVPIRLSNNDGDPCVVYIVTNTGDSAWGYGSGEGYDGFNSLAELKKQAIPDPAPIRINDDDEQGSVESEELIAIPMGGSNGEEEDNQLVVYTGCKINVDVERMFAKLYVTVNLQNGEGFKDSEMQQLAIESISRSCTVETIYNEDDTWYYPEASGSNFEVSRMFIPSSSTTNDGTKTYGPFVMYVPENHQKESTIDDAIKLRPYLRLTIDIGNDETALITPSPSYTAYPGSWSVDTDNPVYDRGEDYNINRNNIYDITLNIVANSTITASANCLIATAGTTIAFFPYYREEEPSDEMKAEYNYDSELKERYDFATYLNYSYEGEAANDGLKIKGVKIVWQTEDCIGNNEPETDGYDGPLVWIDEAPSSEYDDDAATKSYLELHRKIYVKAAKPGNALIAAYDDDPYANENANILWSWHIWVPNEGVDPEGGAIEYYHYLWDETGIDTSNFVPGRLVMNLNLGALKEKADGNYIDTDTYGMIYQWGRKDPFLPTRFKPTTPGNHGYSFPSDSKYYDGSYSKGTRIIGAYDNADEFIDMTGNDGSIAYKGQFLFDTNAPNNANIDGDFGDTDNEIICNSVKHPTTFIAAATTFTIESSTVGSGGHADISVYKNEGDWLPDGDDFLWGGGHPNDKAYIISSSAYLEDDYGPNKTIFDPCPYGWRVAPGDLWLGFTKTGKNITYNGSNWDQFNTPNDVTTTSYQSGFTLYMQGWQGAMGSATSFFPDQGTRLVSGQPYGYNICGNYHNATTDPEVIQDGYYYRKVEIIHFHSNGTGNANWIYPYNSGAYYNSKAVACPLRCVRE